MILPSIYYRVCESVLLYCTIRALCYHYDDLSLSVYLESNSIDLLTSLFGMALDIELTALCFSRNNFSELIAP